MKYNRKYNLENRDRRLGQAPSTPRQYNPARMRNIYERCLTGNRLQHLQTIRVVLRLILSFVKDMVWCSHIIFLWKEKYKLNLSNINLEEA